MSVLLQNLVNPAYKHGFVAGIASDVTPTGQVACER
ncbi:MAG: hypothetical protein ACJAYC_000567 [Halieaceae bacterium]|jgi:hypothetical protein